MMELKLQVTLPEDPPKVAKKQQNSHRVEKWYEMHDSI